MTSSFDVMRFPFPVRQHVVCGCTNAWSCARVVSDVRHVVSDMLCPTSRHVTRLGRCVVSVMWCLTSNMLCSVSCHVTRLGRCIWSDGRRGMLGVRHVTRLGRHMWSDVRRALCDIRHCKACSSVLQKPKIYSFFLHILGVRKCRKF